MLEDIKKIFFGYVKFKEPIRHPNGKFKEILDIQVWSQGRGRSWKYQRDINLRVVSAEIMFKAIR